MIVESPQQSQTGLNSPYGARCFPTRSRTRLRRLDDRSVLMRRLVRTADGFAKMLHVIPGLLFQRLQSDR